MGGGEPACWAPTCLWVVRPPHLTNCRSGFKAALGSGREWCTRRHPGKAATGPLGTSPCRLAGRELKSHPSSPHHFLPKQPHSLASPWEQEVPCKGDKLLSRKHWCSVMVGAVGSALRGGRGEGLAGSYQGVSGSQPEAVAVCSRRRWLLSCSLHPARSKRPCESRHLGALSPRLC